MVIEDRNELSILAVVGRVVTTSLINSPFVARFVTVPLSVTSALTMKATTEPCAGAQSTDVLLFRPDINTTKHTGIQDRRSTRIRMPVPQNYLLHYE
jgi:hypothetical protein